MIRPFTCLVFLLACGSGLYLYQSKHRVKLLDEQIAQIAGSTDALRAQTRMLSAEWTLLNDPERLRQLANQFLTLQTVAPGQFTSLAELDSRLPPPVPPGTPTDAGAPADAGAAPGAAPAMQAPVPVASAGSSPARTDEGRSADAKPADTKLTEASPPAAPKPAATAASAAPPARIAAAAPAAPLRPAERKLPGSRVATTAQQRFAASQPRVPDQRALEARSAESRFAEARSAEPRSVGPRLAEARPVLAPPRAPIPAPFLPAATGSLLGMAHGGMGAPPAPLPLPRPMPVNAPMWTTSSANGG